MHKSLKGNPEEGVVLHTPEGQVGVEVEYKLAWKALDLGEKDFRVAASCDFL